MSRLELDPAQLAAAMKHGLSRSEVEDELTKFVLWRRQHRHRGDWAEAWDLWLDHAVAVRETHRVRVPEFVPSDHRLNAHDREVGRAGVAHAKTMLRRAQ